MKFRTRIYYTETDKAVMWDRWQKGESLNSIARQVAVDIRRVSIMPGELVLDARVPRCRLWAERRPGRSMVTHLRAVCILARRGTPQQTQPSKLRLPTRKIECSSDARFRIELPDLGPQDTLALGDTRTKPQAPTRRRFPRTSISCIEPE